MKRKHIYSMLIITAILIFAGTGIGFEIARQLALRGAFVLLNDIDEDITMQAVEKINAGKAGKCAPAVGNAGEVGFIGNMVEKTKREISGNISPSSKPVAAASAPVVDAPAATAPAAPVVPAKEKIENAPSGE